MNYKELVKPYQEKLLDDLSKLVSIPSVNDPSTYSELTPYGKAIDDCLKEFANIGKENGFNVELDKRYCELSLGTNGPLIEIFGHLDVVPANKLKDRDIFSVTEKDGVLLGRGVADDKGPLLASLYAIKALNDNGLIKDIRVKIFAGGDEEKGGTCLNYYVETMHKEAPKYGFTPDSSFPIIHGEKGVGNISLTRNISFPHIISIKGGQALNVVIPSCLFKVDNIDEIKDKIKSPHLIKDDEITFIGKAAHGANPKLGINAFVLGLNELGHLYNDSEMIRIAECFKDVNGRGLNAYFSAPNLKETIYNLGIVNYTNSLLGLRINFRFPEAPSPEEMTNRIAETLKCKVIDQKYSNLLFMPTTSTLVTSLMEAYQVETGDYISKPLVVGGGTYAKEVKNTLAFGAEFPGIDFKMHQDDEFIPKDKLFLSMAIYAHAIDNLIKKK